MSSVQLPVWVCQACRRTADGGMNRKMDLVSCVYSAIHAGHILQSGITLTLVTGVYCRIVVTEL